MEFKQFYLGCLAQASYLIGDAGEAAIVDPRRDVDVYLEEARARGLTIRHVIETHLHADFVSGHRELAARTGAKIYFGARAGRRVRARAREGGRRDPDGARHAALPRDAGAHAGVRVGARPRGRRARRGPDRRHDVHRRRRASDLLGAKISPRDLAGQLYDSLHRKLLALPDSVAVYPAHGAGSLCGRNISSETSSTIGEQRRTNYALRPMPRDEFVAMMTADLPEAPAYFGRDAALNREGPAALSSLPRPSSLTPAAVREKTAAGAVLLDTRPSNEYGAAHVPGALNIGLGGQFASWAGTLLPLETPIVLAAEDPDHLDEARTRLARVGLETVPGYLDGGVEAWERAGLPLAKTEQIDVAELRERLAEDPSLQVLDVRRPPEYASGHIERAVSLPLGDLAKRAASLDRSRPVAVICASGYRSSTATSLLERLGFPRATNVVGGMNAWNAAGYGTTH
jgi:rhodanese-related sulfurtransferase/glyoxylase-like metal-dependent hydrolase (beta-lactamase superfamily II)